MIVAEKFSNAKEYYINILLLDKSAFSIELLASDDYILKAKFILILTVLIFDKS